MIHGTMKKRGFPKIRVSPSSSLALSTALVNALRIVSTMCLTRLLSPSVFGISGMILSIFFVIGMISDVGIQAYIVRHQRSDEPAFIDAVWAIHVVRGFMMAGAAILLAWPLSRLLEKPELALPLAVAAMIFVVDGFNSMHQFTALRSGRVQRVALLDLTISFGQTISGIILAFFIRSIWAIVASMLISSAVRVWCSYALFPGRRHAFRPDREVAGDLWRFSRMIAASSILTLVISQIDKLAMGRILPLSQFGTYVIASTLAAAPVTFAFSYASRIVYPAAAAAWREGWSISEAYYRSWGKVFYLYAFGGGGLIAGADLLIRLLYDPRYTPAGRYLKILAVSTALTMTTRSMQELLVATGRPRATFEFNVVRLIWLVGGGLIALFRMDALILVLTIGLIELPVYAYAATTMGRLGLIRVKRELTLAATIAAGLAVGGAVSAVGLWLFPRL